MLAHLQRDFNGRWTPALYQQFLAEVDRRSGTHVKFRLAEMPCFLGKPLLTEIALAGIDLILQAVNNQPYLDRARQEIPSQYRVPNEAARPLFVQADFNLVRSPSGELQPRLVEIQGFPSLYAFQPTLAECYRDVYQLPEGLTYLGAGLDRPAYDALLRRAIVGNHDPENVVLLEIYPQGQKTLPDFLLTETICGIKTVNLLDVRQRGNKLYYEHAGTEIPIERIYNRVIFDEVDRLKVEPPFRFDADLQVEWAGHPNWFYLLSKFTLPYLQHPSVPETHFLSDVQTIPDDLDNWVLKPLYSFAGTGVVVGPTRQEIDDIPESARHNWILQRRQRVEPVVETPEGPTQVEIRIMYLWLDELRALTIILRTGRGKMMGVDHNRNLTWVGASAALLG